MSVIPVCLLFCLIFTTECDKNTTDSLPNNRGNVSDDYFGIDINDPDLITLEGLLGDNADRKFSDYIDSLDYDTYLDLIERENISESSSKSKSGSDPDLKATAVSTSSPNISSIASVDRKSAAGRGPGSSRRSQIKADELGDYNFNKDDLEEIYNLLDRYCSDNETEEIETDDDDDDIDDDVDEEEKDIPSDNMSTARKKRTDAKNISLPTTTTISMTMSTSSNHPSVYKGKDVQKRVPTTSFVNKTKVSESQFNQADIEEPKQVSISPSGSKGFPVSSEKKTTSAEKEEAITTAKVETDKSDILSPQTSVPEIRTVVPTIETGRARSQAKTRVKKQTDPTSQVPDVPKRKPEEFLQDQKTYRAVMEAYESIFGETLDPSNDADPEPPAIVDQDDAEEEAKAEVEQNLEKIERSPFRRRKRSTTFQRCGGESNLICFNGGKCLYQRSLGFYYCGCSGGFYGRMCHMYEPTWS